MIGTATSVRLEGMERCAKCRALRSQWQRVGQALGEALGEPIEQLLQRKKWLTLHPVARASGSTTRSKAQ